MATTNLGMTELNASDFVSVDPFNKNFALLDKLGIDYVTESGTNGEWSYRKWKSGVGECWIADKAFANMLITTKWASLYRTASLASFGAYPFQFATRPFAVITFNSEDGDNLTSYVAQQSTASVTQSPKFYLIDPNSITAGHPHFGISVKGKVK